VNRAEEERIGSPLGRRTAPSGESRRLTHPECADRTGAPLWCFVAESGENRPHFPMDAATRHCY